jgi:hypothetical protein
MRPDRLVVVDVEVREGLWREFGPSAHGKEASEGPERAR